ncbi:ATP-binding protein [Sulfurospirillum arcachonense]|uniref:ATP-binding protein n=1 Tax=Sulfurospirillum arcachonense TaxID=57666 RepID=UPI000468C983|nr:ATP-binding protein [Sulfurospirillum arcachonense]
MNSNYTELKNIFVDGEVFDYINLDKSTLAYERLVQTLDKPLKLILFYGKPGTGKTFLLQKIYNDFKNKKNIVFFPRPHFEEKGFLKALYEEVFEEKSPEFTNYDIFLTTAIQKLGDERSITVLIDEAQLYPQELIEKIRLMADSRKFKFLFTVHKTEKEDLLAKDYFQTRIWETIELHNSSLNEIKTYIEKKMLFHNKFEHLVLFKDSHYKLLMKITDGNLRTINKLLYKLFEILEYYDLNKPSVIQRKSLKSKFLEMAAINLGMINV